MRIEDGKGSRGVAGVNADGRVEVSSESANVDASLDRGDSFVWISQDVDIDAADTMLMVRNEDPDKLLVIDKVVVTGGNAASRYECHIITASFTAAGTAVTNQNLNSSSANVAAVTAFGDETGNTQGSVILDLGVGIVTTVQVDNPGIILANGVAFAIDQVTESTAGAAMIFGHFASK